MVSPKPVYYMCRQHETLNCGELHKQLSNSCHSKLMSNLNHANNFDSVVFILACLYCEVRVVRTKFWCKMAGVTFDTIIAITIPRADLVCMSSGQWFPASGGGAWWSNLNFADNFIVVLYLFLHSVLYSVKACKISIYVVQFVVHNMSCFSVTGWTQYGILVLLSNPSIILSCMCIFYII